jgi:hypothetical protein
VIIPKIRLFLGVTIPKISLFLGASIPKIGETSYLHIFTVAYQQKVAPEEMKQRTRAANPDQPSAMQPQHNHCRTTAIHPSRSSIKSISFWLPRAPKIIGLVLLVDLAGTASLKPPPLNSYFHIILMKICYDIQLL